ncbi:MAG TPA: FimV/HubP family polar landmark protein [Candidatus Contendobacter sp.]|nr:FimV/HubP family polar landmark protein [Candidatus Contendobacter sp.]
MPTRILLRLFLLLGLIAPVCAFALGVGQIEVRSALNQTFEAELPLITSNPAELTGLTVRIPRQEEFDRADVERLELLSKLRFAVQTPPGGRNIVQITSVEPIREPNFNLLLELVWARGRLIRDFAIQLDPELYANRRLPPPPPPPPVVTPPPVAAASVAAAPAIPQLPPAPPVSFEGASFYGPVKPGETLAAVANRVRPSTAVNLREMMAILMAGNPAAFVNGNPNTLRSGATLKVPTAQALGVSAPPPILAAAPPIPEPVSAPEPTLAPPPSPPSPPVAAEPPAPAVSEPSAPSPPSVTPPSPTPPAVEGAQPLVAPVPATGAVTPPQAEPPQEIVPRETIPQPEPPAAGPPQPVPGAQPEPPPATPPEPAPVTPSAAPPAAQPQPAPSAAPPAAAESSWLDSPVVWIAIVLIALAIAAVVLLPLLRRPAKAKPAAASMAVAELPESESTAVMEPRETPIVRTRIREPGSVRPRPATGRTAAAPTAPAADKRAAGPAGAPTPKPIGELLKDLDVGLAQGEMPVVAARPGVAPVRDIKAPLLEAEPPTAPVARQPANPFEVTPPEPAAQEKKVQEVKAAPPQPPSELPSELRLDGFDFDFDSLAIGKTARPQPTELPPLELSITEPPPKSPAVPPSAAPADSAIPAMKFEFTDVAQDSPKRMHEDLKLDEALQSFGGGTLPSNREESVSGVLGKGGMDAADYVETKLDLASAYLDMGDQVGARSLLEEVLREGNATQKARAGEFLKKLS